MLDQPQSLIALLIYFVFFGWLGVRRGWKRELIVLAFALGGYLALLELQGRLAFITNTGLNYARAGFPSDAEGLVAVFEAEPIINNENRSTIIFALWALYLFLLYFISDRLFKKDPGRAKSLSFLAGVANSLLYLSLIASRLVPVIDGDVEIASAPPGTQIEQVVSGVGNLIEQQASGLWNSFDTQDQRALVLWTIFTIIAIAAFSLYSNSRRSQA